MLFLLLQNFEKTIGNGEASLSSPNLDSYSTSPPISLSPSLPLSPPLSPRSPHDAPRPPQRNQDDSSSSSISPPNGNVRNGPRQPPPPTAPRAAHPRTVTSPSPSSSTSPPPASPFSLSPPSTPSPLSPPSKGVKIIGKSSGASSPQASPVVPHKPPSSTNLNTHETRNAETQEKPAQGKPAPPARAPRTHRAAPAQTQGAGEKNEGIDGVKGDITKVLNVVVGQQLGMVRTKFAEVKSIPEGVPFIHVLKAITPVCILVLLLYLY